MCNLSFFLCILAKICPEEITPLLPAVSGEKIAEDQTCYFLQLLLKYMVIQVRKESCSQLYISVGITCRNLFPLYLHILYPSEKGSLLSFFIHFFKTHQTFWLLHLHWSCFYFMLQAWKTHKGWYNRNKI